MNLGPSRNFGQQSRKTNSTSHKKQVDVKASQKNGPDPIASYFRQGTADDDLQGDPTRLLTPLDLSLPPFKLERVSSPTLSNISFPELRAPLDVIDEDTLEDVGGMPTRALWKTIVDSYLAALHPTKRLKALISQNDYNKIFQTLSDRETIRLGTPQFRFWARKMFNIVEAPDGSSVVTNGGRPVAIKEHIYDILCMCHTESEHGGRDKTCKVLREYYTWIPKELVANFVRVCPTCITRRKSTSSLRGGKMVNATRLSRQEEYFPGSSRFSVERIEDFGEFPSSQDGSKQNQFFNSISGPSSPVSRPGKHAAIDGGGPDIPSVSTFNSSLNGSFPPRAYSTSVILPPLHSGIVNNALRVEFFDSDSDGSRRTTLPPLMQYLSQSRYTNSKGNIQHPIDNSLNERCSSSSSYTQLDPSLLASNDRADNSPRASAVETKYPSYLRSSDELGENALQLQLYPPTTREVARQNAPPSLDVSISQSPRNAASAGDTTTSNTTRGWGYRNTDSFYNGEGDYSALLSASTASSGLPTPSASGQGLSDSLRCASSLQFFVGSQSMSNLEGFHYSQDGSLPMQLSAHDGDTTKMGVQHTSAPPLFSPRPLKLEDTSAMLELAAAAELDESDS